MKNYSLLIWFLLLGIQMHAQIDKSEAVSLLHKADSLIKTNTDKSISIANFVLENTTKRPLESIQAIQLLEEAYFFKRKYDSATVYTNMGLDMAIKIKDTANMMEFYMKRGVDYHYKNDYNKALSDYKNAKLLYENFSERKKLNRFPPLKYAKTLNNIAATYVKTSKLDSALVYMFESLKIKEQEHSPLKTIASGKLNIGNLYLKSDDLNNAKKWLGNAEKDILEIKDTALLAMCYTNLGIVYKRMGDTIKAIDLYDKSLLFNKKLKREKSQANVSQNLAELYLNKKDYVKAQDYLEKALSIKNKLKINAASSYLGLGKLFFETKHFNKAIQHLKVAQDLATKNNTKEFESDSYSYLAKSYKALGNTKLAYGFLEKHITLKNEILSTKKQEVIEKLKKEFETEKNEKELTYLKKINETNQIKSEAIQSKQRTIIIAVILAFGLLLTLFLFFISRRNKEKKLSALKTANAALKTQEFQQSIEHKTKQLTTHALNMLQKNSLLSEIKEKVMDMGKSIEGTNKEACRAIIKDINLSQKTDKDWALFRKYFENVNSGFNSKLTSINPDLTPNDLRLAALVSLNLSIKETAALLNISPNSVKMARHRLRAKLNLKKSDDLYVFLVGVRQ